MNRCSRGSVPLLVALVLTLGATACGRTRSESGEGGSETTTGGPPSVTENQIKPLPRDQVQDGGRLTWPIDSMPVTFNYNHIDGTESEHTYSKMALMPSIYRADAGGTPIWNLNYLASEPTLITEPRQVVTFHINPKAIWYDGTPITWEDFHWQWRALNGSNPAYQISSSNGYTEIESVARGRDDREVVVTFKNKY